MLTLYGVTRSRASRIVWLCHEIALPFHQVPVIQAYRLADADAPGARMNTRSPGFLDLSPAGAIPVIDDDGLILSESMACTLYLARRHGQPIGPTDAAEDALMMQWSFYAATAIEPDALTILFLHGRDQTQSGEDAAIVADAAGRLIRPLRVVEDHLGRHSHLIGDRFTVADINLAEVLRYAQSYGALMQEFPAITAWLDACQARPAFRRMWEARLAEPE
ncbi:MAG: glutathione S-transferase family protein [Paracoccus sp. (in: a-proteobacteria)]|jgi:glutathione S-transferase|uniref:glutathione S-transferase family protein n=1 Tax=unclassified Paracoccus (in: a-proteobacteria) TaxID=2688777 RepID=UPI000C61A388|nr:MULTISPECIES: glutathione S-transferase family protein [unclassified Paracoccus (in: a-proteobacteria)]MAN57799.1 glutathione S-transferase [Paracoccus sp. (in: a-proteobacteria)]MBA48451.1 glutathione S-transferase [Paracoccus sp. (in: a-proteobacteria)]MDB2552869.1 glutathione S-transferase family protein [Paracoccus sp. (in: a-proteobacteria)]|tara:strand:- start:2521 stop:3180 length:660 start_codon:yes stop_codon:yes gene_type:complete